MRIVFRVDSSVTIGSGHVMRCLTLARALQDRGAKTEFICRDLPGNLSEVIREAGHRLHLLPASTGGGCACPAEGPHASWLEADWQSDAEACLELITQGDHCAWLVVDHYALDRQWEHLLRKQVGKIMVIDDLADRAHDCDLLLDQNFYLEQGRYEGLVPEGCQTLLGPGYALLRPEFKDARPRLKKRTGRVERILVFFGGVDEGNETVRTIEAIMPLSQAGVAVDVVLGVTNPHRAQIVQLCEKLPTVHLHCQVNNMAELLAAADLAIGAGGTMTWERCCLGLPALVIAVAENQRQTAADCARNGCQIYLGTAAEVSAASLLAAIQTAQQSPTLLESISSQAMRLVDGRGADRVAQTLVPLNISLRVATIEDCQDIYFWRNAEETRRHIFNQGEITFKDHQRWFEASLESPDRELLIGLLDEAPVGVLRYDLDGTSALVSVYLVPGRHPSGTGSALIRAGSLWLQQHRAQIRSINAEIFAENIASIRAFEKAGYELGHLTFRKELLP